MKKFNQTKFFKLITQPLLLPVLIAGAVIIAIQMEQPFSLRLMLVFIIPIFTGLIIGFYTQQIPFLRNTILIIILGSMLVSLFIFPVYVTISIIFLLLMVLFGFLVGLWMRGKVEKQAKSNKEKISNE